MAALSGTPPGPAAGDISPMTVALRPSIGLTSDQCETVRRLRRAGVDLASIAGSLGVPAEAVERAALAMRTPNPRPQRRTINATLEAAELVERESQPGEPRWRALDRLLSELLALRERELHIAAFVRKLRAENAVLVAEVAHLKAASGASEAAP